MASVRLVRRYRFCAAHRLHTPLLSDEANRETYGKCNNPHGHGHNYVLEVAVTGELDPQVGRLVPLAQLDVLVEEAVLRDFSTRNLNVEVAEFAGLVPTTENVAAVIARRLALAWQRHFRGAGVRFEKVRIWETRNNIFEAAAPEIDGAPSSEMQTAAAATGAAEGKVSSQ